MGRKETGMAELTDEQIAQEEKFLEGLPRVNLGALFMPGIWGPAHGMWPAILFYPIWILADNVFYTAYLNQTVLSLILAVVVFASLAVGTVVFAILGQPFAAHRAASKGVERETYIHRERIWVFISAALAVAMIALATYYNLVIRPGLV